MVKEAKERGRFGYELVFVYIPGFPSKLRSCYVNKKEFRIHSWRPVEIKDSDAAELVVTESLGQRSRKIKNLKSTNFSEDSVAELKDELQRFWPSLAKNVSNLQFLKYEWDKHMRYNMLKDPHTLWEVALKEARKYLTPEGDFNLERIMEELHYVSGPGRKYKCDTFVSDLEKKLKQSVRVNFRELDGQLILRDIIILYNEDLSLTAEKRKRETDAREFVLDFADLEVSSLNSSNPVSSEKGNELKRKRK